MANYLLIVNNNVMTIDGQPVIEVNDSHNTYYALKNAKDVDITEKVTDYLDQVRSDEKLNPIFEYVGHHANDQWVNAPFMIKVIYTPLYKTFVKLAKEHRSGEPIKFAGSHEDFREYWEEERLNFLIEQFDSYATLVHQIESRVNALRLDKHSPFRSKYGYNRMLSLVYASVAGLFNPLEMIVEFHSSKLLSAVFDWENYQIPLEAGAPIIFNQPVRNGDINVFMATSSDVMKLLNIDEKEELTSAALYRLIGGVAIRNLYPRPFGNISEVVNYLPIGYPSYRLIVDESQPELDTYFVGTEEAAIAFGRAEGFTSIAPFNSIAAFVNNNFPKYKKTSFVGTEDILQKIGGAYFV